MAQQQPAEQTENRNRRQYERVKVAQPIKLEATLRGRFIDIMRLEMTGMTIDMSNGGFCANVDQSISPGVRCRVELADKNGGDPRSLWGRVRRTDNGRNGYVVALEFDEPQEAAELLGDADIGGEGSAVIEVAGPGGTLQPADGKAAEPEAASDNGDGKPAKRGRKKRRLFGR